MANHFSRSRKVGVGRIIRLRHCGENARTILLVRGVAVWVALLAGVVLPTLPRGVVEIVGMILGSAWAVSSLVRALDPYFEFPLLAGVAVSLAEWSLCSLVALWIGLTFDLTLLLTIAILMLLWPAVVVPRAKTGA